MQSFEKIRPFGEYENVACLIINDFQFDKYSVYNIFPGDGPDIA